MSRPEQVESAAGMSAPPTAEGMVEELILGPGREMGVQ